MKLYLAAPSIYQERMRTVRDMLHSAGHFVTSRWLDVDLYQTGKDAEEGAKTDIVDIDAAEVFVLFTLLPTDTNRSGGHHWEHGYAWAIGKDIVVVGPTTSVFQELPDNYRLSSVDDLLATLEKIR